MNSFVILFRRRLPALSVIDRQRLNEQTALWAKTYNTAKHHLDPRILGPEAEHLGTDGDGAAHVGAWSLSALLFVEAEGLAEAVKIARTHPALSFGFQLEVRPWTTPAAAAGAAQSGTAQ